MVFVFIDFNHHLHPPVHGLSTNHMIHGHTSLMILSNFFGIIFHDINDDVEIFDHGMHGGALIAVLCLSHFLAQFSSHATAFSNVSREPGIKIVRLVIMCECAQVGGDRHLALAIFTE